MIDITWTKQYRRSFWTGAIPGEGYAAAHAFGIIKVGNGQRRRMLRDRTAAAREWRYEYRLHQRGADSLQYLVGTYPTLDDAKAAALTAVAK